MNQTSLDKQSGAAEDGALARIVRLETNMDNVTSILSSLQRREEEHHQSTLARMDHINQLTLDRMDRMHQSLLDRMDSMHQSLLDRTDSMHQSLLNRTDGMHQSLLDRLDRVNDRIERSDERHSRDMHWVIGLLVANTAAIIGVAIRLLTM